MFFGLQVDRGNLTQAVSDTFLDDLKLNTNGKILNHFVSILIQGAIISLVGIVHTVTSRAPRNLFQGKLTN